MARDDVKITVRPSGKIGRDKIGYPKVNRTPGSTLALELAGDRDGARAEIDSDDFRFRPLAPKHRSLLASAASRDEHPLGSRCPRPTHRLHPFQCGHGSAGHSGFTRRPTRIRPAFVALLDAFASDHGAVIG